MNAARAAVMSGRLWLIARWGIFGKELLRSLMVAGGFAVAVVLLPSLFILPFRSKMPLFLWFEVAGLLGTPLLALMLGLAAGVEDEGTGAQAFVLRLPVRGWRVAAGKLAGCLASLLVYVATVMALATVARLFVDVEKLPEGVLASWQLPFPASVPDTLALVPYLLALVAFPLACGLLITSSQVAAGVVAVTCVVARWIVLPEFWEERTLLLLDAAVAVLSVIVCLARMEYRREGQPPWPFFLWTRGEASAPRRARRAPVPARAALRVHVRVLFVAIIPELIIVATIHALRPLFPASVPYAVALFFLPGAALAAGVMGIRPAERDGLRFIAHALPVSPATLWGPRLVLAALLHSLLAVSFVLALLDGTPSSDESLALVRAWALLATLFVASHLIGSLMRLFLRNAFIAWFAGISLVVAWQDALGMNALVEVARGNALKFLPSPWAFFAAVALPLACLWVCAAKSTLLTLSEGRRFLASIVMILFLGSWGSMLMTASLHEFLMTLWLEARL